MKAFRTGILGVVFTGIIVFSACSKNNGNAQCAETLDLTVSATQLAADISAIDAYLQSNEIDAVKDDSGLRYVINEPGTGTQADICSAVSVIYTGKLLGSDEILDSVSRPVIFNLKDLITGWQIGIPKIKEGGKITLYIPSVYAYGNRDYGGIPANSNLVFTITLTEVR